MALFPTVAIGPPVKTATGNSNFPSGILSTVASPFGGGSSSSSSGGSNSNVQKAVAPASTATQTPADTGGGGTGTGTSTTPAYSAQALADYTNLKNTTLGSIQSAIGQGAAGYNSSILDYLDSRAQQQNGINSDAVNNELAREQGSQSITDMVNNGIRSSGVLLANNGGGSSSGAEALARAYGTNGRQQMSAVGNQFAQGQNKVSTEENALLAADATQSRHTQESKASTINNIVNSATTQLAALNQQAAYASIPDRVQIDQQIAQIKAQAMSALSAYDAELSSGIAGQPSQTTDQTQAAANQLRTAGVASSTPFDYTTDVPAQLQGTGPFASSLPIFISPNAKKQTI